MAALAIRRLGFEKRSEFRLSCHRQCVQTVGHRFVLGNSPTLPSALKKSSPASTRRSWRAASYVDCRFGRLAMAVRSENSRCPFQQLAAPCCDLVRVNVELLCQLGHCSLALHGSQCHVSLHCWNVLPACSLRNLISCSAAMLAALRQKLHLAACPDLPSPLFAKAVGNIGHLPGAALAAAVIATIIALSLLFDRFYDRPMRDRLTARLNSRIKVDPAGVAVP